MTIGLVSFGTGSGVLAIATCTGGVSGGRVCDGSGKTASAIGSGRSGTGVVPAAICATAAVATSALATTTLATVALATVACFCGASA